MTEKKTCQHSYSKYMTAKGKLVEICDHCGQAR